MSHIISPYDSDHNGFGLGAWALVLSVALHVAALVGFIVLGALHANRPKYEDVVYIQLMGSLAPPAPAAPSDLPVNPNAQTPDIVERPKSVSTPPAQVTPAVTDSITVPDDVIPLGPEVKTPEKPPEPPKRIETKPPAVTPPKVEPPKPAPKPKPQPNLDAQIAERLKNLERRVEAADPDDDLDSRMMNVALATGRGDGEGSERGGATSGVRVDLVKQHYYEHVRDIIESNWTVPGGVGKNSPIQWKIIIEPNGRISSSSLVRSSGDEAFDLSLERAVQMSSNKLPELPAVFENKPAPLILEFDPAKMNR